MPSVHIDETPPGATVEVYEAQSSSVLMAFRSVSCTHRYLSSIGLHIYLDDLRNLRQKKVTNLERRKTRIALTILSSIPERDCFTALES